MKKFLFISRHTPTVEQHALANAQGIALEHHGDANAFTVSPSFVDSNGAFEGVIVVHPAAALRLAPYFEVGVFENGARSEESGNQLPFVAKSLHIYDLVM